MSVEVARTSIYPNGFDALDSSSGDTDEFIKSVKDSLQRGRYDTTAKAATNKHHGVIDSEDEQPSLPLDDEADIGSLEQGGNSLTEVVEVPLSDDEDDSKWLSAHLQNNLVTVKQSCAGVEDLVMNYPNDGMKDNDGVSDNKEADTREEKDLLSMVLDEIPDNLTTPPLMSSDIAHMSVRQKMLQELENSRESVFQMERVHQEEVTKLKEMLECAKVERKNERSHLQQRINSLHKELESSKRKIKNMERDHTVLLERTKEAEQVAQKIEVDSIQNKMALDHEQDVNKLKMAHKAEMIKLQHMLKEKEQELKMSNQLLYEERESLASVRFQLEECRRDNQIKLNKVKTELASKTEEFHRQVKKEKSLAVSKAVEEANLQKSKEFKELQLKCQDDKMAALNKMERKFTSQLQELQKREQEMKRDHVTTPTQEVGMNSKHLKKIFQDHSSEKVKQQQRVHQLEQELHQAKNEIKLLQQQQKEATNQHDKEKRAIAMEIMEECHKMSTLLMKRIRSGKSPIANCWAAIVQLKNTNEELANQIKELTTQIEQEKQSAVKVNRERLSEIRKLQKNTVHLMGKSSEQQRLEKQLAVLKEKFIFLNKEHLLLEGEVNKLRK